MLIGVNQKNRSIGFQPAYGGVRVQRIADQMITDPYAPPIAIFEERLDLFGQVVEDDVNRIDHAVFGQKNDNVLQKGPVDQRQQEARGTLRHPPT